jgi:hypothetical protein
MIRRIGRQENPRSRDGLRPGGADGPLQKRRCNAEVMASWNDADRRKLEMLLIRWVELAQKKSFA